MRAIQEELGDVEDTENEVNGFLEQLAALELEEKTREKVEKEIRRFGKMQPMSAEPPSAEHTLRPFWPPWNTLSEDNIDLAKAEEILHEDHYGLDKLRKEFWSIWR